MPKARYEDIYRTLREDIEEGRYPYGELLPSENTLKEEFSCSRNTIRRALGMLAEQGYVQSMQGKGVRSIFEAKEHPSFFSGEIETFREAAERNGLSYYTKVILFCELVIDERLHKHTGFEVGLEVYYIQRLHYIDGMPLILNHNYFRKDTAEGLDACIASRSIYAYLENTLGMTIVNSRRTILVSKITELDEKYLDLNPKEYNCLAVVESATYNSDGIMFEFTISRHRPDYFRFTNNAIRHHSFRI